MASDKNIESMVEMLISIDERAIVEKTKAVTYTGKTIVYAGRHTLRKIGHGTWFRLHVFESMCFALWGTGLCWRDTVVKRIAAKKYDLLPGEKR